ncbi:hypothetical protein [Bacteroides finegoldii]
MKKAGVLSMIYLDVQRIGQNPIRSVDIIFCELIQRSI